jgi:hypothetical protein
MLIARAILDSLNVEERETFIMLLNKSLTGYPGDATHYLR